MSITYYFPLGKLKEFKTPLWLVFPHQLVLWGIFISSSNHNVESCIIKIPIVLTQWKKSSYFWVFTYSVQEMRLDSGSSLCKSFGYGWLKAQVIVFASHGRAWTSIARWLFPKFSSRTTVRKHLEQSQRFQILHICFVLFLGLTHLCVQVKKTITNWCFFAPKRASSESSM